MPTSALVKFLEAFGCKGEAIRHLLSNVIKSMWHRKKGGALVLLFRVEATCVMRLLFRVEATCVMRTHAALSQHNKHLQHIHQVATNLNCLLNSNRPTA